jgi:hypothetical protein
MKLYIHLEKWISKVSTNFELKRICKSIADQKLLKPNDCSGLESDPHPKAIPKTITNSRNQLFFQNLKERGGNENGDKLE